MSFSQLTCQYIPVASSSVAAQSGGTLFAERLSSQNAAASIPSPPSSSASAAASAAAAAAAASSSATSSASSSSVAESAVVSSQQGAGGGGGGALCPEFQMNPSAAAAAVLGLYGAPYAAQAYGAFLPYTAAELSVFSQLGSHYEVKDSPGLQHSSFAYPGAAYYGPYGGFQYADPSRPKNATRESTATLKAWLGEHRKNPYPTKGEKIMLAIITKMTLTQVSTWFANARRRLKKENKVTWAPRARSDEEGQSCGSDAEVDRKDEEEDEEAEDEDEEEEEEIDLENIDIEKCEEDEPDEDRGRAGPSDPAAEAGVAETPEPGVGGSDGVPGSRGQGASPSQDGPTTSKPGSPSATVVLLAQGSSQLLHHHHHHHNNHHLLLNNNHQQQQQQHQQQVHRESQPEAVGAARPKIWSLAETATSPDSPRRSPSGGAAQHTCGGQMGGPAAYLYGPAAAAAAAAILCGKLHQQNPQQTHHQHHPHHPHQQSQQQQPQQNNGLHNHHHHHHQSQQHHHQQQQSFLLRQAEFLNIANQRGGVVAASAAGFVGLNAASNVYQPPPAGIHVTRAAAPDKDSLTSPSATKTAFQPVHKRTHSELDATVGLSALSSA